MTEIVFMDTETTGLSLHDDIWEFAGIRRFPDGSELPLHMFIHHDTEKAARLPHEFKSDYQKRFRFTEALDRNVAAWKISDFTSGATIIGAVPNFDTERLALLFSSHGIQNPRWHYHLIDVENLVVGYLAAKGQLLTPPWSSDSLSRAIGVEPNDYERHTAMGDVLWCRAQYDVIMAKGEQ